MNGPTTSARSIFPAQEIIVPVGGYCYSRHVRESFCGNIVREVEVVCGVWSRARRLSAGPGSGWSAAKFRKPA